MFNVLTLRFFREMELPPDIESVGTKMYSHHIYRKTLPSGDSFYFVVHVSPCYNSTAAWVTNEEGDNISFSEEGIVLPRRSKNEKRTEELQQKFGVSHLCDSYICRDSGRFFLHQVDELNHGFVLWEISAHHEKNPYDSHKLWCALRTGLEDKKPHEELLVILDKLKTVL